MVFCTCVIYQLAFHSFMSAVWEAFYGPCSSSSMTKILTLHFYLQYECSFMNPYLLRPISWFC